MEYLGILRIFIEPNVLFLSILTAGAFSIITYFAVEKEQAAALMRTLITPGIKNSWYHLRGGEETDYFFDMDYLAFSAANVSNLSRWYVGNINQFQKKMKVDALAFIERENGPVGAITEKDLITYLTKTDSFVVRPKKRIKAAIIKDSDRWKSKNVVVLNDVTTTGQSMMRAIQAIEDCGGKVVGAVSVVNRGGEETKNFFRDKGIDFKFVHELKGNPLCNGSC